MFSSIIMKWVLMIFIIVLVIFSISCFFLKNEPLREMKSKFESGIDENEQDFPPFYMHFFYIGILFLVFDVEIVLSIPIIQSAMNMVVWPAFWILFMSIILAGLMLEVMIDSVEWKE
uniref:NADH dehydrogenase subunit 3 n=1 Tax=Brueelia nebulosa TaxID=2972756 RepID=UPI0023AA2E78|nr:NADH dehydrogenase subunit 3 [Brueelia nebulosa]WCF77117.1 NADH dehydrogenase subunit 3 [Brueelia nebulosa]